MLQDTALKGFYYLCTGFTTSNSQSQFYRETYFYLMVGGGCLVGLVAGARGQLAVDLTDGEHKCCLIHRGHISHAIQCRQHILT